MKKRMLFVVLLFCVFAVSAQAWERSFKGQPQKQWTVEPLIWRNSFYGDVNADGLSLNFKDEANFSTKNSFGLRFATPIPFTKKRRWVITYNGLENSGNVNKNVELDGIKYNANANLKLRVQMFDFCTNWSISRTEKSYFDFVYGTKFQSIKLDLNGVDSTTGLAQSGSWKTPALPLIYVGFGGSVELSKTVMLNGVFKWFDLSRSSASLKTLDADINLGVKLSPDTQETEIMAFVGYRNTYIHGEYDDAGTKDRVKVGYRGPVFGLVARF